jgi:hypothetical protein
VVLSLPSSITSPLAVSRRHRDRSACRLCPLRLSCSVGVCYHRSWADPPSILGLRARRAVADPQGTAYLGGRPSHPIFVELRYGEVRRTRLPRARVNKRKVDSGFGKPRPLVDATGAVFGNGREGAPTIREAMWSAWQGLGLGHLRLAVRESGVVADGLVLGVADGRPFRLSYEVRCDPYWRVRAARVGVPGEPPR